MARVSRNAFAAGGAVLALFAAAVGALTVSGSSSAQASETLVVVASLEKARFVDAPGRGRVGNYEILRFGLKEQGDPTRIGVEVDHCLFVFAGRQMCNSAFVIHGRGRLAAEGLWNPAPGTRNVFPITGGTGDFVGAGGTARFEDLGNGRVRITFKIS